MLVSAGSASTHATSPVASAALERVEVVELDDASWSTAGSTGGPMLPGARHDRAVRRRARRTSRRPCRGSSQLNTSTFGRPVICAGEPQREAVRVGGRQRDLPQRQPEAAGQLLADPIASSVGSIVVIAALDLRGDRRDHRRPASARPSRRCRRGRSRRSSCPSTGGW